MASFWYFIKEILLTSDANKINYAFSSLCYFLPFLIVECLFTLCIAFYLLPQLSQYLPLILEIIITFILVTIIISLCLDLFCQIRLCFIADLRSSLYNDLIHKSARYGEDYMYYEELITNYRYLVSDNPICAICRNVTITLMMIWFVLIYIINNV